MEQKKPIIYASIASIVLAVKLEMAEVMRVNSVSMQLVSLVSAVAYPGFSQRGAGTPTYYLAKICQKLLGNEGNWTERGTRIQNFTM